MVLKLDGAIPMLQLHGEVFELLRDPEANARYLQLPLRATSMQMPVLGNTPFFPTEHYMLNHSMDVTVG